MAEAVVYTPEEMKEKYGPFFHSGSLPPLEQSRIPQKLWPLIPYAAFWGIADDRARETLVRKATKDVQQNLKAIVAAYDDYLDEWLAGEEASDLRPSAEYVAFSAMRMAADFI
jgi:hypothetical protein